MKPRNFGTTAALRLLAMSMHRFTPAVMMTQALKFRLEGNEMEAMNLIRMVGTSAEPWKSPNQRQRRKQNRQRHAMGDRRAFAA